jgi:hypothetical protein
MYIYNYIYGVYHGQKKQTLDINGNHTLVIQDFAMQAVAGERR